MPFPFTPALPIPPTDLTTWSFPSTRVITDSNTPIYIDAVNPSSHYTHATARETIRHLIAGLRSLTFPGGRQLEQGDTIAISAFNSIHYPILVNGIVAAGYVWAGTNPAWTTTELAHAIKAARVVLFIAEPEALDAVVGAMKMSGLEKERILVLDHTVQHTVPSGFASWRTLLDAGEQGWNGWEDDQQRSETTTAVRLFSSGTTGLPKAVMLSHRNLIAEHVATNDWKPKSYKESRLSPFPFFHVSATSTIHFSPLRSGVPTYILRRFAIEPFLRAVARHRITDIGLVPPMVIAIIMHAELTKLPQYSLRSVLWAWCGAAPLEASTQRRLRALLGDRSGARSGDSDAVGAPSAGPPVCCTQIWGMTETTCMAFAFAHPEDDETGSVGYALPGVETKLVDEAGRDVSATAGVWGELCVRGPIVSRGYTDAAATRASWDADGFLHTGDVAYRDGDTGKWYIVDRRKELIKVRGWQVAPAELEATLMGLDGIEDAAVIGVYVPTGDGLAETEVPRAYVVRKDARIGRQDVERHMAEKLTKYKRLDGGVIFVDEVPRTPSGKILKKVLRERAAAEMKREQRQERSRI